MRKVKATPGIGGLTLTALQAREGWKVGPNRTFVCKSTPLQGRKGLDGPAQAAAQVGKAGVQGSCRRGGNGAKESRKRGEG